MNKRFSEPALTTLLHYTYPGNVRELRNLVESLLITSPEELITPELITPEFLPPYLSKQSYEPTSLRSLSSLLEETEKKAIMDALSHEKSIRKAAKRLDISHATLLRKLQKFGLQQ